MSDTIIILTCTVKIFNVHKVFQSDSDERLKTYIDAITKWQNTDFKIIIVDNSGYTFPEIQRNDNIHILSYMYNEIDLEKEYNFLLNSNEKGHHEMISIYRAFNNIPTHWNYSKILKLTGRYFIPNFKKYVDDIPENYLYYIQNRDVMCELYGGKKENVIELFKLPTIKYKRQISETIKKERIEEIINNSENKNIVYKFPRLDVDPVIKGSRNTIMRKI
tara:strand:- start:1434 stop:2090 length:657 start_codon:yes stop_codon:yes gene_type:complete